MERAISSNGIIVFNRYLNVEDLKAIPKDFRGDVVVHGDVNFLIEEEDRYEDLRINFNIWAEDIYCENINCDGNIYSAGCIHCTDVKSTGNIISKEEIVCRNVECDGDVLCGGFFYSNKGEIKIKGSFICKDVEIS